ncbi:hypothetical protein [Ruminococcus bicirculans (ex Wegman et al. 2014)]|uniref:hypothetical protein n=1 Tax=Ruminococcus bicirculans (ex Wegman et al. 2014) TaxID=1160721 RepID=UPI0025E223D0|nr:hypothetical protein [uncultured Ruminococcus sp.]
MRILVLGGAGYIGSHTALELVKAGQNNHRPLSSVVYGLSDAITGADHSLYAPEI